MNMRNVFFECNARGWHIEADGGGADGWHAEVYTVDENGFDHILGEGNAHTRSNARIAAFKDAVEKYGGIAERKEQA